MGNEIIKNFGPGLPKIGNARGERQRRKSVCASENVDGRLFFVGGGGDRDSSASNKGRNGMAFHRMIAQGFRLVVRRLEMPAP